MRISDWSSDVCSSDLSPAVFVHRRRNPSGFGFDLPHDIFGGLRAEAAGQAAYAAGGGLASGGESGSGHRATGIAWAPDCKKAGGPISDWRRRAASCAAGRHFLDHCQRTYAVRGDLCLIALPIWRAILVLRQREIDASERQWSSPGLL